MMRERLIHQARVYLRESKSRRTKHRAFSFVLLGWAANCRREAAMVRNAPNQLDMFA